MTEINDKAVEAAAAVLLGRVNAPEQEIYAAARAALSAALPHLGAAGVAVRELEWTRDDAVGTRPETWSAIRDTAADFDIWRGDDGRFRAWSVHAGNADGSFDTLEAAKAAAQRDYETRILSALERK